MKNRFEISSIIKYAKIIRDKMTQSIRIRLMLVVVVSIVLTVISVFIVDTLRFDEDGIVSDKNLYGQLDHELRQLVLEIRHETEDKSLGDLKKLQGILDKKVKFSGLPINYLNCYVLDHDGNVLVKSETEPNIGEDISYIIKDAINSGLKRTGKIDRNYYRYSEAVYVERLDFEDGNAIFVVMQGMTKREITLMVGDYNIIPFSVGAVIFVLSFFLLTRREVEYIEELSLGVTEISKGNLDYRVKQKTRDELGLLATRINFMSEELKLKIEEERKAEKTKNELITNMSHDLRTPLTSIMGYLRMLKDKKYEDTDQLEEYIDIAYTKSEKLKTLIDDLFVYSKLANEETILYRKKLCLNDMLVQLAEELSPVADERNMTFVRKIQNERVMVHVDADKLVRVFENLLSNAIKYGYSPGEIIISMVSNLESVSVRVSNKGDNIPQEELPLLFNRLYMVDKSRSSSECGSGLGLAISKSIVNLHNGQIWAECEQNNISFCVELPRIQ